MQTDSPSLRGKWRNLGLLALATVLSMTLWFSASAVVPQLTAEWGLTDAQRSWLTMSVQLGFVIGALLSAALNLADRISNHSLIAAMALLGAFFNGVIAMGVGIQGTIVLRVLVGVTLAGVYPPGMKLVASWTREDRGLGIGLLVAAIALGSAAPHLLNAFPSPGQEGMPPWRDVLLSASILSGMAALLVAAYVRPGPFGAAAAEFHWRHAAEALANPSVRLANFGYLGHMWELYSMWTWVPIFLIASYQRAGWSVADARVAGFAVVAIGAVGSLFAGVFADRLGRTTITIVSLAVSGFCCLIAGFFFGHPGALTVVCLVWGLAVVADSAQFSAAVSELSDPRYVGTALTVQTSLGFLLTMITIHVVPPLVSRIGWTFVFMILALGPAFGIWSMWKLRQLPEARRMASGHR